MTANYKVVWVLGSTRHFPYCYKIESTFLQCLMTFFSSLSIDEGKNRKAIAIPDTSEDVVSALSNLSVDENQESNDEIEKVSIEGGQIKMVSNGVEVELGLPSGFNFEGLECLIHPEILKAMKARAARIN